MRRDLRLSAVATLLCVLCFPGIEARAADNASLLRPGGRPFFAGLHFGATLNVKDAAGQGRAAQEFGYNLRESFAGPAFGLALQQGFGNDQSVFQLAPKFWWKFQLLSTTGLYLSPFLQVGFAHLTLSGPKTSGSTTFMNWQVGLQGHLLLGERFYVMVQPLALDLFHTTSRVSLRYDALAGAGVLFP